MTIKESELKKIIRESIEEVMAQTAPIQAQSAPQQQQQGLRQRYAKLKDLNKRLWAVKQEAESLQLENVSKWIYMAIQSMNGEFVGDTVRNGVQNATQKIKGLLNPGQQQ